MHVCDDALHYIQFSVPQQLISINQLNRIEKKYSFFEMQSLCTINITKTSIYKNIILDLDGMTYGR